MDRHDAKKKYYIKMISLNKLVIVLVTVYYQEENYHVHQELAPQQASVQAVQVSIFFK